MQSSNFTTSLFASRRRPRSALLLLTVALVCAPACGGRENGTNGSSGGDAGGCIAVGGRCLIGSGICAGQAATQFSCGGITPAGFYCCLPSDPGSSDDGGPDSAVGAAQAFAIVTMGPSAAFPGQCMSYPSDTTVVEVGQPGTASSQPVLVTSGTTVPALQISCSVHPQGSSYAVNLEISQANVSGSGTTSLGVTGLVDPTVGVTMNVDGEVSTSDGGEYPGSCSVTFNTPSAGASPSAPPVAAGRIWAHLSCPSVQNAGPGMGLVMCDIEADFIFENCGQ